MSGTAINLPEAALQARLRDRLNQEGVKLWEAPFYVDTTQTVVDGEILALASRYATELNLTESDAADSLYALQRNAIERLTEKGLFKETGVATLRIKFSGFSTPNAQAGTIQRVQIDLARSNGKDLRDMVAKLINVNANRLKLICTGKVLNDENMLNHQNVKNGAQIMVLSIGTDQETFEKSENQFRELEETKGAADYLAGKDGLGQFSLQVADQSGKSLDLPEHEKKSLAIAIALHEKGRAQMKLNDFSKALVFLLESDGVYGQCKSGLLDMVDNYGVLNLDLAWCYLNLQSIAELPNVDARLTKCEKALHRAYGENMERVLALKGSTGWEAALFVRLHLLQAVASYHQGHVEKAKFYLAKVEAEMNRLQVSDEQLADLINMGYGADESRMALRSTYGNVAAAVDWIIRKREEKDQIRQQEREDLKRRKLQKKLGTCNDGQPVNVMTWRQMKEMGFSPHIATAALKRANNDLNLALQLSGDERFLNEVQNELIAKATAATAQANDANQPTTSANAAAQAQPTAPADSNSAPTNPVLPSLLPESYSDESLDATALQSAEDIERSQKAFDALAKDTCSESEYIDLTLSAENVFLNQYKNLLNM